MSAGLTVYPDVEQRSPEWHRLRAGVVTASTVGTLLTPTGKVASNDTSRRTIARLAGERITGHVDEGPTTGDMWRGIITEPYARDQYERDHGVTVDEVGLMVRDLGGGALLGCSPDGLVGDDGGIEVKCPRAPGHLETMLTGRVPSQYMAQVQAALLVSGRSWWDYVSYCGGMPLEIIRVAPDRAWHDAIRAAVIAAHAEADALVQQYAGLAGQRPLMDRITDTEDIVI